jgi:hypothetical protein
MKRADFWHGGDFGRYLIVRRASNNGHVNGRQPDADNPTWHTRADTSAAGSIRCFI